MCACAPHTWAPPPIACNRTASGATSRRINSKPVVCRHLLDGRSAPRDELVDGKGAWARGRHGNVGEFREDRAHGRTQLVLVPGTLRLGLVARVCDTAAGGAHARRRVGIHKNGTRHRLDWRRAQNVHARGAERVQPSWSSRAATSDEAAASCSAASASPARPRPRQCSVICPRHNTESRRADRGSMPK